MILKIESLNYASSGGKRGMVNLDYSSGLDVSSFASTETFQGSLSGICDDTGTSALMYDMGNEYPPTRTDNATFVFDRDDKTEGGSLNVLNSSGQTERKIYPLYDVRDVMFKTPAEKDTYLNKVLPDTDMKVDIYAPRQDEFPIGFCGFQDRAIVLASGTDRGPRYVDTSFRKSRKSGRKRGRQYTVSIGDNPKEHFQYPTPSQLGSSSYGDYVKKISARGQDQFMEDFYRIFSQEATARGISSTSVLDVDQTTQRLDFQDGNMYGTSNPTKTTYGDVYSIAGNDFNLGNSREYLGLIDSGNGIYLKYVDGVRYSGKEGERSEGIRVSEVEKETYAYKYQKIERYRQTRVQRMTGHKSNLFSIKVLNSGLERTSGLDEAGRKKVEDIKTDIENAVKEIVRNVAPVNTQLFKVFFEEGEE